MLLARRIILGHLTFRGLQSTCRCSCEVEMYGVHARYEISRPDACSRAFKSMVLTIEHFEAHVPCSMRWKCIEYLPFQNIQPSCLADVTNPRC
jgi:hypothetical protein